MLYGVGLRRSEAVALDVDSYDRAEGTLRVIGKGNRERLGYATGGARDALETLLELRGDRPGPLFYPINRGGGLTIARLTGQAVYAILPRLADDAGVAPFSPRDLRRTFVSDLLDAGADRAAAQRHAEVQTTARYERRGEHAKRKAAELLRVPFTRPVAAC